MLAIEYLDRIIANAQQAKIKLEENDKRRSVGLIDEVKHDAQAVTWILIDEIISEEGKF